MARHDRWGFIILPPRSEPVDDAANTDNAENQRRVVHVGRVDRLVRWEEEENAGEDQENNGEGIYCNPIFTKVPYRWR